MVDHERTYREMDCIRITGFVFEFYFYFHVTENNEQLFCIAGQFRFSQRFLIEIGSFHYNQPFVIF